jgi:hypothetical protein
MGNVKLSQELDGIILPRLDTEILSESEAAASTKRIFATLLVFDGGSESKSAENLENLLITHSSYIRTRRHDFPSDLFFIKEFHYASPTTVGKVMSIGTGTPRLGCGPCDVLIDDKVCILNGSDVPVLLRQCGPAFEVVGNVIPRTGCMAALFIGR